MSTKKEFPFAAFFNLLSANGIKVTLADYDRVTRALRAGGRWTSAQLGGVLQALLVKNPEQERTFRKCFDSFFSDDLPEYSEEEISKFRRSLNEGVIQDPPRISDGREYWRFVDYGFILLITVAILSVTISYLISGRKPSPTPRIQNSATVNSNGASTTQPSREEPSAKYTRDEQPSEVLEPWQVFFIVLSLCVGAIYFVGRIFGLGAQAAIPIYPIPIKDEGPYMFALSQIGSEKIHLLSERTLDQLSGSLRHAMSERPSKRLDLKSSISMSARQAGLMSLVYQHVLIVKRVYVLVDLSAEPLRWNSTARELASGLSQRGVQVTYGDFYGSPERFRTMSGRDIWLEDLEDSRNNSILFIFSDGKQLKYKRDRAALESLARWPVVAWLDLRESKFWDESARLIRSMKIPLFPANEGGLMAAAELFLTEHGSDVKSGDLKRAKWHGPPAFVSGDLDAHLETLLGDALPWAQTCAMMQPLPLKLANTLRSRFAPELPPERVERLFRLPGTWWDASGLHFSDAVLSILRSGFTVRWEEWEQVEILRTIIDEIRAVEPPEKNSLRHLAWEYALERVRLELEPDASLPRLIRLLDTPLATHVRAELARLVTTKEDSAKQRGNGGVPLRKAPETTMGLRQLQILTSHAPLGFGERFMRGAEIWWQGIKSYRLVQFLIRSTSATFELLINFPYHPHERNASGYRIKNF